MWHEMRFLHNPMDSLFIPKKFEIQFRQTGENEYTGALLLDGMEMSIGKPKTLEEITAFLMPERRAASRVQSLTDLSRLEMNQPVQL